MPRRPASCSALGAARPAQRRPRPGTGCFAAPATPASRCPADAERACAPELPSAPASIAHRPRHRARAPARRDDGRVRDAPLPRRAAGRRARHRQEPLARRGRGSRARRRRARPRGGRAYEAESIRPFALFVDALRRLEPAAAAAVFDRGDLVESRSPVRAASASSSPSAPARSPSC